MSLPSPSWRRLGRHNNHVWVRFVENGPAGKQKTLKQKKLNTELAHGLWKPTGDSETTQKIADWEAAAISRAGKTARKRSVIGPEASKAMRQELSSGGCLIDGIMEGGKEETQPATGKSTN